MEQRANEGKSLLIEVDSVSYSRTPVKTHVITDKDTVAAVLEKYAKPLLGEGDVVFMSEKAVACTQRRAIPMKDIKPRPLARFLCKFVYKNPFGIGLSIPQTMEMALQECGTPRILFAAFISVIGKLFGRRGWFYKIAGEKARSIDGPCDCTIPPYNEYVVLGPLDPDKTATEAAKKSGCPLFCIVDINDLGGNILGVSEPSMNRDQLVKILKDNPLGQSDEQTPLGIIHKVTAAEPAATQKAEMPAAEWVQHQRENIVEDLRRIVKIRSVSQTGTKIAPFGQGCRDVLDEMLKICEEAGVENKNHDYYCGTAYLPGKTESEIGLWSHLDVVPEGGDWQYPPYGGQISGDFMIGRGVTDNKSAAILSLYALKYFKSTGKKLNHGLRVFFGTNEEDGMEDERHYIENNKLPDYSLIPDAEFPVCYGEKGIIMLNLHSPALKSDIAALSAGLVSNMVAGEGQIRFNKTDELLEKTNGLAGVAVLEDAIEISAKGKSSHAALPEGSVNAIAVLADLLLENNLLAEEDKDAFAFIAAICGDYSGGALGIAATHEEFGALTCIGGKLGLKDGKAVLDLNIRYPYCEKADAIIAAINAACTAHGFALTDIDDRQPSYVPRDSAFVKALMSAFAEAAGKELPAYIMGGGTYARNLPNAVAFGHEFPEEMAGRMELPPGHGGVHQPDEAISISGLLKALEIYILAIGKLDALAE